MIKDDIIDVNRRTRSRTTGTTGQEFGNPDIFLDDILFGLQILSDILWLIYATEITTVKTQKI